MVFLFIVLVADNALCLLVSRSHAFPQQESGWKKFDKTEKEKTRRRKQRKAVFTVARYMVSESEILVSFNAFYLVFKSMASVINQGNFISS